jgi:hypothetical protein
MPGTGLFLSSLTAAPAMGAPASARDAAGDRERKRADEAEILARDGDALADRHRSGLRDISARHTPKSLCHAASGVARLAH